MPWTLPVALAKDYTVPNLLSKYPLKGADLAKFLSSQESFNVRCSLLMKRGEFTQLDPKVRFLLNGQTKLLKQQQ